MMKKPMTVILTVAVLLLISLASAFPEPKASAIQPNDNGAAGHPLWNVITYEVKHDMVPEFEDLLEEAKAAYERVGAERYVLQVVRGPSATYMVVTARNAFADYDTPARSLAKACWRRRMDHAGIKMSEEPEDGYASIANRPGDSGR